MSKGAYINEEGKLVVDMAEADKLWNSMDMEQQYNAMCAMFDPLLATATEQAARIRELEAAQGVAVKPHDRELAYQEYINEPTPNGNTRMDNILGCTAPCSAKVERHVATQIDMAFQAGWSAALRAIQEQNDE